MPWTYDTISFRFYSIKEIAKSNFSPNCSLINIISYFQVYDFYHYSSYLFNKLFTGIFLAALDLSSQS